MLLSAREGDSGNEAAKQAAALLLGERQVTNTIGNIPSTTTECEKSNPPESGERLCD